VSSAKHCHFFTTVWEKFSVREFEAKFNHIITYGSFA